MGIKQQRLGQIRVSTATTPPPVDQSGATLANGLASLLNNVVTPEVQRRQKAVEEQGQATKASEMQDRLLDIGFSALAQKEKVSVEDEAIDANLSPREKQVYSKAQAAVARIKSLEDQQGMNTRVRVEQAKVFAEMKAAYPDDSDLLTKVFEQSTGSTPVELLGKVQADISKAAAEEREALKGRYLEVAKGLGIVVGTETLPQLMAMVAPYEDQLVAAATAQRKAAMLTNLDTVDKKEQLALERNILEQGRTGELIEQQVTINRLMEGYDPAAVDQETRDNVIQQLQFNRRAYEVKMRDTFRETDPAKVNNIMKPVLDGYDDAIKVASGEMPLKRAKYQNDLRREMSLAKLYNVPGFVDTQVALGTLENIPGQYVSGDQTNAISMGLTQDMLTMLSTGQRNPDSNPYPMLADNGTPAQTGAQYRALRDVVLADLGNSKAADTLNRVLTAWTNQFTQAPEVVPARVYDAMTDVFADPKSIPLVRDTDKLGDNLVNGFAEYTNNLRAVTAEALAEELNVPVKLAPTGRGAKSAVLSFLTLGQFDTIEEGSTPKLFELMDVSTQKDGSLVFTPKSIPELQGDREIARRARELTRTVGPTVGKLVRSYAHVKLQSKDYAKAAEELMSMPNWRAPLSGVEGTGFGQQQQAGAPMSGTIDRTQ